MVIVSHRGNLIGPGHVENNPIGIEKTCKKYITEIDVWYHQKEWYLGHDYPKFLIPFSFFDQNNLILHCKNHEAMIELLSTDIHFFWHQNDTMTLTSKKIIWCQPNYFLDKGIVVDFGDPRDIPNVYGICTDKPDAWSNFMSSKMSP